MIAKSLPRTGIEILESRIAPASAIATAQFVPAAVGGYNIVHAGQGLGTAGSNSGTYLLYVEKGTAIVFNTDLNHNGVVDFNEITGIAASDGLRLISFVDIHGDIVTNLDADSTLSDSDNNTVNDFKPLGGDGRVLNNSRIEKIELRSLTSNDLVDQNGDGVVDDTDVSLRLALSSYSIFGNIYAGKGFGVPGDAKSGLIIDASGHDLQANTFTARGVDYFFEFKPTIDSIKTGTAASLEYFNFGVSERDDVAGTLVPFTPPVGQAGGDIAGVKSNLPTVFFNVNELVAGNGGANARGGNIQDVTLNGDQAGGYKVIAGDGGSGNAGGAGGSIINFQDLSSETGAVVVQTGSGGTATSGAGGSGGSLKLGTFNVNGGISIALGNGGSGFTAGGNGASLTNAKITTPEGDIEHVLNIVGTTHDTDHDPFTGKSYSFLQNPNVIDPVTGKAYTSGQIGRTRAIDFNHDGFGDQVYSSDNPDQLVVMFGDGFGGFQTQRINLNAPVTPDAVTVADFNGDGFMDIAVASNSTGNFDGVVTFLAKTEDVNGDGILSKTEDLNGNGKNDFIGFQSGRHSTLPSLYSGDPDANLVYGFRRSAVAINDIEAGDFNGDGFTDMAVAATYTSPVLLQPTQVVMFMLAEVENGRPTGQFYADVGTKANGEPPVGANPFKPFYILQGNNNKSVIEATSMTTTSNHDVIVGAGLGQKSISIIDNYPNDPLVAGGARPGSIFGPSVSVTPLGKVDTNRQFAVPNGYSGADATMKDLTIVDGNADGIADIAVLNATTAGTVVIKQGNGVSFPVFLTNNAVDNAGLYTGNPNGFGLTTELIHIRATDLDGDGHSDEVAILTYADIPAAHWNIIGVDIADVAPLAPVANPGGVLEASFSAPYSTNQGHLSTPRGFDLWTVNTAAPAKVDYLVGEPGIDDPTSTLQFHNIDSTTGAYVDVAQHYISITTGNGGNALLGKGGAGGFVGGSLTTSPGLNPVTGLPGNDAVGAVQITLPQEIQNASVVNLVAGLGGDGFTSGGQGGDIRGVSVRYVAGTTLFTSDVNLFAGNGGFGVSGAGGAGGSLVSNSIDSGVNFVAGHGGDGLTGGSGGSIIGNGQKNGTVRIFDSRNPEQFLTAGIGGDGVKRGGDGGTISGFAGSFALSFFGAAAGTISYSGGEGGDAISGAGGKGGSVLNSSPVLGENRLAGDILLQGGAGGDGVIGGAGGDVSGFVDKPSTVDNPAVLSVIGGDGGRGISGAGGRGGNVSGIEVPTKGKLNPLEVPATNYSYDRILGGNGGISTGNIGGAGGTITGIKSSSSDNPFVLAAGAGGAGLKRGGDGGSITNSQVEVGSSSLAKLLVIAGAGGDASAFLANPLDTFTPGQPDKSFGGQVGVGGNGGSIVNFTQGVRTASGLGGNLDARVDLIAGNGGDTVNYGTVADSKITVGKGGSISNIAIAGSIGNTSGNVPIKSYIKTAQGETMTDFVNNNLRDPQVPGSFDDNVGNVGLIAGAAGRLKVVTIGFGDSSTVEYRSQPATKGINGSVSAVAARNIMSMVAGAVDRVAAIQVISNISVVGNGDVGSDKGVIGVSEFLDPSKTVKSEPALDGSLIDGAIVYRQVVGKLPTGSVYQLA